MHRPEWYPNYSEVQNLVYSASGDSVETVFVDGRIIMENRRVLTVDEDEILNRCAELGEQILARGKLAVPSKWPIY
jgi:5-methylthioadenosine/S-adenosylhomocysteine deaminase